MEKKKEKKSNLNKKIFLIVPIALIIVFLVGFGIYKLYPRVDSVVINAPDSDIDDEPEFYLKKGEQQQLNYTVFGNNVKGVKNTFESSNSDVAIIDDNGLITALNEGETEIKVTSGKKSDVIKLSVAVDENDMSHAIANDNYRVYYNNREIKEHFFMGVNVSRDLVIKQNNKVINSGITWTSKDTSFVTVSNGKVTSKAKLGETMITAKIGSTTLSIPVVVEYASNSNIYALDVQNSAHGDYNANNTLVKTKSGKWALLDAGQVNYCGRVKNYLWDLGVKELEFVLISHLHSDHYECFQYIANAASSSVKVKNLYIKEHDGVGVKDSTGLVTSERHYNDVVSIAKKYNIPIKLVTPTANYQINLDEIKFYFGNRHRIFAENGNTAKCNATVKYNGKNYRVGRCNENVESITTMIKIDGSKRSSYSYIAADAQNKGMKNAGSGVTATFSNNGRSVKIKELFGPTGKHESAAGIWDGKKWVQYYDKYNILYSAEDRAACWARNIVAKNSGKAEINCEEADVSKKRASILKSKVDLSDVVDIDMYLVTHHGRNASLTTFSYLRPTYALLTSGGGKGVAYYAKNLNHNTINKLIYAGKMNQNNIHFSGLGTIIYSVDSTGRMLAPVQINNQD